MKKKCVSLLLFLAMMLSMVCAASAEELKTVSVTGTAYYSYAFQVLDLVNQEREAEGLSALTMDTSLLDTAMLRAAECSILFDENHTRPDGSACYTANDLMCGENIACGYGSPEAVMEGWMNSEGHRANILTDGFTTIGVGCVNINGTLYWVQDFGYSGSTPADPSSYTDSGHTWTIQVSEEYSPDDGENDPYYVIYDSIEYLVLEDQAVVTLCDENAAGAITIPPSVDGRPVTAIDYGAFQDCTEITSVSIPDTVTAIYYNAFLNCYRLESVNIPSGVTFVGADAFSGTLCFKRAYQDGVVYYDNWLLYVDEDLSGSFTLNSGTVGIAEMAALYCEKLTDLTIPASVKYINNGAFGDCTGLSGITFQGSAPEMEENIFTGVTASVGYPADNATWNADTLLDYGGNLSWTPLRFVDLPEKAWYTSYANQAVDLGLMSGIGNNLFSPAGTTTRAMLVQILYNMAGSPAVGSENPFTDVPSGQWYSNAVQWAYENNVTSGTSATTFSPNANVTREQIAVFLYSYRDRPEVSGELTGFTDAGKVSSWAKDAMLWATRVGILSGAANSDGTLSLNPLNQATRAEAATMMVKFYTLSTAENAA